MDLVKINRALARDVSKLKFSEPVSYVYNPLLYAREPFEQYLKRYGFGRREVVLLGMNPGPFGMVQTGVPFGDVEMVRTWLGIAGEVGRPPTEHPKRVVRGFACNRSEVSGRRFWGWARDRFGTPEKFFERFFVMNYCPLAFIGKSGSNLTPDKLPSITRDPLLRICDAALRESIKVLSPRLAIGIGHFARKRLEQALAGMPVAIDSILHPSPASPAANRGWDEQVDKKLTELGVIDVY